MATDSVKIRAKVKDGTCEVRALIKHPMETGQRKDKKTGKLVPAHFIQEVTCQHNGKEVLTALWGGAVSANPYLSFMLDGVKPGDAISLSWIDNTGDKDSGKVKAK